MGIQQYQKLAYNSYSRRGNKFDPRLGNKFDPRMNGADGDGGDPGTVVQVAEKGQKMQINVSIVNATASGKWIELWYYLNSFSRNLNGQYVDGNYLYIPQLSYEGIKRLAAGTDGTVGFNSVGSLIIRGAGPTPGPADPLVTISCKEIPYSSLFEASNVTPIRVAGFKYTVTDEEQFDEKIEWIRYTFAGAVIANPIQPRSFVDEYQQINNMVTITAKYDIAADRGLRIFVLDGQNARLSLFINNWTDQLI